MADYLRCPDEGVFGDIELHRSLHNWELDKVFQVAAPWHQWCFVNAGQNNLWWRRKGNGRCGFLQSSFKKGVVFFLGGGVCTMWGFSPLRLLSLFGWRLKGKILTTGNLIRRSWSVVFPWRGHHWGCLLCLDGGSKERSWWLVTLSGGHGGCGVSLEGHHWGCLLCLDAAQREDQEAAEVF